MLRDGVWAGLVAEITNDSMWVVRVVPFGVVGHERRDGAKSPTCHASEFRTNLNVDGVRFNEGGEGRSE